MLRPPTPLRVVCGALLLALVLPSCWGRVNGQAGGDEIVLNLPIRTAGPGSLDPVRGSTTYDNQACSLVYETLLQYKYLKRPPELEPLLLVRMPEISDDGLLWKFELRDDVHFQDDACFVTDANPDGAGRQMVAEDVIYSWKRIADKSIGTKNWWLVENTIRGFDEWRTQRNLQRDVLEIARRDDWGATLYELLTVDASERDDPWRSSITRVLEDPNRRADRNDATSKLIGKSPADDDGEDEQEEQKEDEPLSAETLHEYLELLSAVVFDHTPSEPFDLYAADVPGLRITGKLTFEVELAEPVARFSYILAMFQLSVIPREAVEYHGKRFPRHPVGSGPYTLDRWQNSLSLTYVRSPSYHDDFYPDEWEAKDEARGLHEDAGKRLPLADRINIRCYVQDQPMWLEFRAGFLDFAQIPAENFEDAINKRTQTLKPEYAQEGLTYHPVKLLDFIFRGFNCDEKTSPILGGHSDSARKLRQAISLATDFDEFNETFYNGQNIVYDGMIPPTLAGHPKGHRTDASYNGPDVERASRLLAEAGYPNGEGLPVFDYYVSQSANSQEQSELSRRQLATIGIKINPILLEFAQLIDAIDKREAPLFSFAWGSDYPDGENNLALFYGPNESPGSNHYNYSNPEYDKLYEQIRSMQPSPERDAIYERMRDMVLEDAAFIGSMARTRNYLGTPRLKNFKPTEDFWNWPKYLTIAPTPAPSANN